MTAPAPADLLAELHKAADAVASTAAKFIDEDIKAPAGLPGWTRGHVLAHLAGISNAMARQLEYAARGATVELYDGGQDGRTKAIEMAAGHNADAPGPTYKQAWTGHGRLLTRWKPAPAGRYPLPTVAEWSSTVAWRSGGNW
ncbi:UNVERIFIED_ORG: uncharacterized protein (TIGR03083 family) [Arthrobacter sp. UYEF13]